MQSLPSVKQETQSLHLRKVEGDFWVAKASSVEPLLTDTLQQMSPSFWNIAQTATEVSVLSVVAKHDSFTSVEGPWSVFGIVGQLDFSLTGVLSKCSTLLAESGVSVFAVSTFDTDYFLVRKEAEGAAVKAWTSGGLLFE